MKAISIKQPWAFAILRLCKDIENRTWATKHRGPTLVHASKSYAHNAPMWVHDEYKKALAAGDDAAKAGGIVGSVNIIDCIHASSSEWWHGPVGFLLSEPKVRPFRPLAGKLNFFEVADEQSSN